MKIIISPAKKMKVDLESFPTISDPIYISQAIKITNVLKKMSHEELSTLWHASEKIVSDNEKLLHDKIIAQTISPAITSYVGLQYQYMLPGLFTQSGIDYAQNHLRILSALYGVLKPLDGIHPYRLSMEDKLSIGKNNNLYKFWGDLIYQGLDLDSDDFIVNLASEEYAKAVRPYLTKNQQMFDILFYSQVGSKLKVKATYAKMARGEMVRYLVENDVTTLAEVRNFQHIDYQYRPELSDATKIVFVSAK